MIQISKNKTKLFKKLTILFIVLFVACFYISTGGYYISWSFLALLSLISYLLLKKVQFTRKDLFLFVLSYILGAALNLFSKSGIEGTLGFLEFDSQILTLLILMVLNPSLKTYNYIIYTIAIASIIASFYGFFLKLYPEYYVTVYNESPSQLAWRLRSFRTIINWGEALQFAIIIILSAVFAYRKRIKRFFFLTTLFMLLVALFFSGSRSAFVSIIFGVGIMILFHIKKRFIIVFSGLLIVLLATVYNYRNTDIGSRYYSIYDIKSNQSNIMRVASWETGIEIFKKYPIFGVGVNNIEESTKKYYASLSKEDQLKWNSTFPSGLNTFENSYINVLAQSGIIYFLYFFGLLFYFMISIGLKLRKLKHKDKFLITGIYSSLVAFMVNMVFFHSIEGSAGFFFFFMMFYLIKYTDDRYLETQD